MLGTAIIVFREVLEAALIVGIVAAATRGVRGRGPRIALGVALGLAGSCAVAAGADAISSLANGIGQEILNAGVLFIAVTMLAWHNIWMSAHGREFAAKAKSLGGEVRDGTRGFAVLMVVVALAVLREGSETVLFLYGVALAGESGRMHMLAGGALGLAGGVVLGWLLYAGLLRVPLKWFFTATSALVLLLAAGMASQAARFLIQADLLPGLASPLWDTTAIVPNDSAVGSLLRGLVGYEAQPAGMQVLFFALAFTAIVAGMTWAKRRPPYSTS